MGFHHAVISSEICEDLFREADFITSKTVVPFDTPDFQKHIPIKKQRALLQNRSKALFVMN